MQKTRIQFWRILFLLLFMLQGNAQASLDAKARTDLIFKLLYWGHSQHYIGESISQLDHARQCAHQAALSGEDNETIIAALLHDIGHLLSPGENESMNGYGVMEHEKKGANFLRKLGFSEKIAQLVEGHVEAKRYLVFKDKQYAEHLSLASQETLKHQGGPMSATEAHAFEKDPLFQTKLKMRTWDEKAKVVNWDGPRLDHYYPLILAHLMARSA